MTRAPNNPTALELPYHLPVPLREVVVITNSTMNGTRFERDAIETGDRGGRCLGEKQGSRRSIAEKVLRSARPPGTDARR